MSHAEVRDRLEFAALEPDGLDRLMAGDTPEAAGIAGHLAGCPACLDELDRLRRTATLVRLALDPAGLEERTRPSGSVSGEPSSLEPLPPLPPELRERTLAFVRELGVPRPLATGTIESADQTTAAPRAPIAADASAPVMARERFGRRRMAWIAAIAAAVVFSVVASSLYLGGGRGTDESADLAHLAAWSIDVARAPDARQVALTSPAGGSTAGLLAFVPSNGKLVVSAHDLAPAPAGKEYRCWWQGPTGRIVVGRMFFAGGIAYWVGPVSGLGALVPGTRFGVTLVDASGSSIDGDPILVGTL
jgi:hypothetical protein